MRKTHKVLSGVIFIFSVVFCYMLGVHITEAASQNLVTFFSVVFGFYMTCVAILYGSSYVKRLYKELDPLDKSKRKIHTLRSYFFITSYWSIFSITLIIIVTLFATKTNGAFVFKIKNIVLYHFSVNLSLLINGIILGVAAINVFYMLLLLNTILDGMIEETKNGT